MGILAENKVVLFLEGAECNISRGVGDLSIISIICALVAELLHHLLLL